MSRGRRRDVYSVYVAPLNYIVVIDTGVLDSKPLSQLLITLRVMPTDSHDLSVPATLKSRKMCDFCPFSRAYYANSDDAIAQFQKAARTIPKNPIAQKNLAEALRQRQELLGPLK